VIRLSRIDWLLILFTVFILAGSTLAFAAQPNTATARLPLVFEANHGQAPVGIGYLLRGASFEGEFQKDGVLLRLLGSKKIASQVKVRLVGAREDAAIAGGGKLDGHTNYLIGNDPAHWLRGLPNYTEVRYIQIYTGTDLVFYGSGGSLEHDFEVQPGADPKRIALQFEGAKNVALGENGDLQIGLTGGAIAFSRPIAYQTVAGVKRNVDAAFTLDHDGTVRFRLGRYDTAEKLVIDPVLSFSTYLSQQASDANLIATDADGNNYISGYATLGFPVTSGAFAGCANCTANSTVTFLSKLSPDGSALIYSTVLGGNDFAQPTGIAVDANENVILSGWTGASDFPTKNGQQILAQNNNYVGFLVSLSADGSSLNYGTLLSVSPSATLNAMTYATAVAVDSSGNAYVTGETGPGFAVTSGALDQIATSSITNSFDVYLAKFSPTGTLIYSALLGTADPQNGGGGPIGASAIAVDAAGDAYVTGQAGTLWPITSGAYLSQIAGTNPYATPFVMKVAPDATSVVYSTYLDYAYVVTGIAALSNGNVFVTGNYAGASYPTTPNAYQQNSGLDNAFLTELNSDGSGLVYSTVIGDSTYRINGLTLDQAGNIWLAGQTSSAQFPLLDPVQATFPSSSGLPEPASVLNEFDPTGETLEFASYLGGDAPGYASSVAVDANGKVHVSGAAQYGMYTTAGAYLGSVPTPGSGLSEATYAYVALVDPATAGATLCLGGSAGSGLSFGYLPLQTTASQGVQVTNCGGAPLNFSSIASNNAAFTVPASSNSCTGSIAVSSSCTVNVEFEPTAVQAYSGQLTFTSNASVSTTSISLSGSGGAPSAGFGPPGITQTLNFPSELVGQTSPAEFIPLYNNGTVPLTIYLSQITVTSGFTLAPGGTCTSSLPAYQSCLISIEFAPTTAGSFSGTLSVSTNDPVHPTISTSLTGTAFTSYPAPTITALLNPSYPVNSGTAPITMNVSGTNFFPTSAVYIDGVAQTTTYQSDTSLTVTFAPSLLNAVGQIPVTVVNPTPGGGTSNVYPLTVYLSIPLTASALTVDPVGGLLYAAIPASASQNPNTIIPINPATGAMMTPIPVASNPQKLAVSDDGSELYVASTGVLQRINLHTLAVEATFNLPVDPEWGQTYVQEMHVVPGSPKSIVVELFANVDPAEDGAALYNDSGLVNWIPGQSVVNGANTIFWLDSFTFTSSPSVFYGLSTAQYEMPVVQVGPTGLSYSGALPPATATPVGSIIRSDGTLLYTNVGGVWNPATMTLQGSYLEANGSALFYCPSVLPDPANSLIYFLDGDAGYDQYQALTIDVYNLTSYALLGEVPFTSLYSPDASDLVRWGSNGFAFRMVDITGAEPAANQIVILTSNLVANPNAAPVPVLSSVSPAQVYAGGPAYTMQLTGSGFTSASTVLINGNPRSTTYVNGTTLTCQVTAADIATVGQLDVQVTTPAPGGGTSSQLAVSIQAPPSLTLSASPASVSVAQNGSGASTISLTDVGGFTGTVALAASGLPSGVTASFAAGTTAGTQVLTLSASSTAALGGPVTVTITGTSGALSATTTVSLTVTAEPTFGPSGVTGSNGAITVNPGATTGNTSTISVAGTNGYSGTVNLSCSISPTAANDPASCSLSPASVTLNGSTAQTSMLTVTTTSATTGENHIKKLFWPSAGGTALALVLLFGVPRRRHNWLAMVGLAVLFASIGAIGCGGGSGSGGGGGGGGGNTGTSAGTYTVTVTGAGTSSGSSSSVTATVGTVTLTVN
jgi:hypothetical protein